MTMQYVDEYEPSDNQGERVGSRRKRCVVCRLSHDTETQHHTFERNHIQTDSNTSNFRNIEAYNSVKIIHHRHHRLQAILNADPELHPTFPTFTYNNTNQSISISVVNIIR